MCHGGGVHCQNNSSPLIENCVFLNNRARGHGAGGYVTGSAPIFRGCVFADNQAVAGPQASGGGLSIWGNASPLLVNCIFIHNLAQRGGGAIGFYGSSRSLIRGCVFVDNEAVLVAGGDIEVSSIARPHIVQCTFYGGSAPAGGALSLKDRTSIEIERSIIAYCSGGEAVQCRDQASAILRCCDLFGNSGGDWIGCIAPLAGQDGNVSLDPDFVDPEQQNLSLAPDSPLRKLAACGPLGAPLGAQH